MGEGVALTIPRFLQSAQIGPGSAALIGGSEEVAGGGGGGTVVHLS